MGTASSVPVAPSNTDQLGAWDGDEGAYWAAHADRFDRSIAAHHERLMAAASFTGTDRVLDVGCGSGQTTRDAARAAVDGHVVGVDLSAAMLGLARRRADADGLTNVDFVQADAQIHGFDPGGFDVAIGRTSAMFFGDHHAAFENIGRAVAPGGRLVLVTWQGPDGNEWLREIPAALAAGRPLPAPRPDAPGPFALADPDRVRSLLSASGWTDIGLAASDAPMWFGTDPDDAHAFVLGLMGWLLEGLDEGGRRDAAEALRATMAAHRTGDGVTFASAAWVITATRV